MSVPEVSIIIPAYNTEAYIYQAIESALSQTIDNVEVIVVDDASTDQTLAIAKSFTDERLKVIASQKNSGAAAARNCALQEAKGEWIAILDSDDWYTPDRLEKLLKIAYKQNADMIADDVYYIKDGDQLPWNTLLSDSGEKINKITHIDSVYFVETDLPGRGGLTLGLTKPIIKRNFLTQHGIQYDKNIKLGQDFWFYLTCLLHNARFVLVPEAYYFYRSRANSLVTRNQVERLNQYCAASQKFLEQDLVKHNPPLRQALLKRLRLLERTRPYFQVIDNIKNHQYLISIISMIQNPYFFVHFSKQIPKILSRRFAYYFATKSKFKY